MSKLTISALVLAALGATAARADEPAVGEAAPDSPPAASAWHWYGGRILLADGASLAVMTAAGFADAPPLLVVGAAGWVLASPILHAQHGSLARGVGALALRVGLPVSGFLIGKALTEGCWRDPNASDTCDLGAEMAGTLMGAISAGVIDSVWLARDRHEVAPPGEAASAAASVVVLPERGGALMGLAGRF